MKITKASTIAAGPRKYAAMITPGTATRPSNVAGRCPARRKELKSSAAASVTATAARASTAGGPARKHRSKTAASTTPVRVAMTGSREAASLSAFATTTDRCGRRGSVRRAIWRRRRGRRSRGAATASSKSPAGVAVPGLAPVPPGASGRFMRVDTGSAAGEGASAACGTCFAESVTSLRVIQEASSSASRKS